MADAKPQELDPALVERTGLAAIEHMLDRRGLRQTLESIQAEDEDLWKEIVEATGVAALLSLGIPAAALNALAKGEAVVVPKVRTLEMITATPFLEDSWDAQLAASPYRSEP